MLNGNSEIKVGIYKDGVHIRIIAECDLFAQDNGHKEEAVYFFESTFIRDPNQEFTEPDIAASIRSATEQLKGQKQTFTAKTREEADMFISKNTKGWETIRPLSK